MLQGPLEEDTTSVLIAQVISVQALILCEQEENNLKTTCKQVRGHLPYWADFGLVFSPQSQLAFFPE